MITGSVPFQALHTSAFVASSHMKRATLAMVLRSGRSRLLTSPSCSTYSETSPLSGADGARRAAPRR